MGTRFERLRARLRGIKFHHLGFGLFWSVSFIMFAGIPGISSPSDHWLLFVWSQQIAVMLALGGFVLVYKRDALLPSKFTFIAGFSLSAGSLLYFLSFSFGYSSLLLSVVTGATLGFANAIFFLQWQSFYASEGQQRATICIPLSAILAVAIYAVANAMSVPVAAFMLVVLLPFLAMLMLEKSTSEMKAFPTRPLEKQRVRQVIKDIWKPIFCACAIGFVWCLSNHIPGPASTPYITAIIIGVGIASLLIALISLSTFKGLEILHIYQILFPFVAIIFFLPIFFGEQWSALLAGTLMLGLQMLRLLLFITCAAYSSRSQFSPIALYGICVLPLFTATALGDSLGYLFNPTLAYGLSQSVRIMAFCFCLLFAVLIIVTSGKKPRPILEPVDDTLLINPYQGHSQFAYNISKLHNEKTPFDTSREAKILQKRKLSPREIEVALLLLKGNSIAAIAEKLFISENTIRGHAKSIYKKLDIHSRQDLIDFVENEANE